MVPARLTDRVAGCTGTRVQVAADTRASHWHSSSESRVNRGSQVNGITAPPFYLDSLRRMVRVSAQLVTRVLSPPLLFFNNDIEEVLTQVLVWVL